MEFDHVRFSGHALRRMIEREIHEDDVLGAIRDGEAIAEYADDSPLPSVSMLYFRNGQPLHVLVAKEESTGACLVVTVYRPDPESWTADFRNRRNP